MSKCVCGVESLSMAVTFFSGPIFPHALNREGFKEDANTLVAKYDKGMACIRSLLKVSKNLFINALDGLNLPLS